MHSVGNVWATLGIAPTADERSIKRAYARLLKGTRPEDDPAAFQALHDAYQHALRIAPQWADDDQNDATDDSVAVLADATVAPL
ncbi:MAG: J domain-containing protein, partial [Duganella sp.]